MQDDGTVTRHPLAYLLEAADDISYRTADLEDAFKKGLFTLQDFITFFKDCACLFSKRNTDITSNIAKTQH